MLHYRSLSAMLVACLFFPCAQLAVAQSAMSPLETCVEPYLNAMEQMKDVENIFVLYANDAGKLVALVDISQVKPTCFLLDNRDGKHDLFQARATKGSLTFSPGWYLNFSDPARIQGNTDSGRHGYYALEATKQDTPSDMQLVYLREYMYEIRGNSNLPKNIYYYVDNKDNTRASKEVSFAVHDGNAFNENNTNADFTTDKIKFSVRNLNGSYERVNIFVDGVAIPENALSPGIYNITDNDLGEIYFSKVQ